MGVTRDRSGTLEACASTGRLMPNSDAQYLIRPVTTDRANKKPSDLEGFQESG
jgi:hypothetical protein